MLKVYNTLSGKKETFKPKKGKKVNLFVCGPTVYDAAHLGHARTYLAFDIIAKYLKNKGYSVAYLQNITDIDDKVIQRAKEKGLTAAQLAAQYEKEYLGDMRALGITAVTKYARATAHIKEIISQIQRLKKKGFTYEISDGIYYDVARFKDYGKLSHRTVLQAEDGVSRIDDSWEKRNKADFCLWKFSKIDEPKWPSPFGDGRPGWHIEDTAITEKYFGAQYDVHGGAQDLIFPHHEAELSQMEAISGKVPMVKYWLHTGFLKVNGQKMSKSLGNFVTIKDLLKKHAFVSLRFFVAKNHYRSPVDFSEEFFVSAESDLEYIWQARERLQNLKKAHFKCKDSFKKPFNSAKKTYEAALENDFNTPEALGVLFKMLGQANSLMDKNKLTSKNATDILAFLQKIDAYFGFIFWKKPKTAVSQTLKNLVQEREKCRKDGNWQKADEIRKKVQELGWQIDDTPTGPLLKEM